VADGYVNFADFFDLNRESAAADAVTDAEAAAQQSAADAAALQNVQAQFEADSRAGGTKNLTDYSAFLDLEAEAKRRDEYARSQTRSVYDDALGPAQSGNPLRDSLGTARAQAAARMQKEAGYRKASQAATDQRAKARARKQADMAQGAADLDAQRRRIVREGELREKRNKSYEQSSKSYGQGAGGNGYSYDQLADTLVAASKGGYGTGYGYGDGFGAGQGYLGDYNGFLGTLSGEDRSILQDSDEKDARKRQERGY